MKARLEDKKLVISLRKQGLSYKEIQGKVQISKGLLSRWLKYMILTQEEEGLLKERIKSRQDGGRLKASLTNRTRRMEREKVAFVQAEQIFKKSSKDQLFLIGIVLYWAEGSKSPGDFQFINSDPDMIIFMDKWIKKFLKPAPEKVTYRLFIHRIPGYEGVEAFWAKKLGIEPNYLSKTIYKPTVHLIKKNPNYKGCCRIGVSGIYYLRLMKAWQKLLIQYYGECA